MLLACYRLRTNPDTGFPDLRFPAPPVHQPRRHRVRFAGTRGRSDSSRSTASNSSLATATQVLLPLVFCRECGQEYYSVRATNAGSPACGYSNLANFGRLTNDGESDPASSI